ncbi:hypothetical protein DIZ27_23260 [Streptomyces sp. NWU339]|uniref:hypothetical protein n=1 Tax=Streptomyces sp. NWU339 TaxID=2185284 RepID=UPI000D677625|nr:hypothetical protein [Streptomyces sp. NWU339]PWI08360.1 hypothetical protein DIZ27_23260 [Streptomyces sp. NWU339]
MAADPTQWLTAAAIGSALYLPGALLVVHLAARDLPSLDTARAVVDGIDAAAERAAQKARLQLAALLLLLAWHLETKEVTR